MPLLDPGTAPDGRPMVHPLGRLEWRAWLEANHLASTGIWLVNYRLGAGKPRLSYDEAVEEALCFGWVDSKPNKLDGERSLLWFAPRKARSAWSRINKARIERLTQAGLMAPAGLSVVEAAKASGTWNALDKVEALEVPDDLSAAFGPYPDAAVNWEGFSRTVKRGILEWIAVAKRPETRAQRGAETARLAAANEAANQWRPRQAKT